MSDGTLAAIVVRVAQEVLDGHPALPIGELMVGPDLAEVHLDVAGDALGVDLQVSIENGTGGEIPLAHRGREQLDSLGAVDAGSVANDHVPRRTVEDVDGTNDTQAVSTLLHSRLFVNHRLVIAAHVPRDDVEELAVRPTKSDERAVNVDQSPLTLRVDGGEDFVTLITHILYPISLRECGSPISQRRAFPWAPVPSRTSPQG